MNPAFANITGALGASFLLTLAMGTQSKPEPTLEEFVQQQLAEYESHQIAVPQDSHPLPEDLKPRKKRCIRQVARQIAVEEGVKPERLLALIEVESSWRPNVVSEKGAYGYTQLMPDAAKDTEVNRYDAIGNIQGGARYIYRMHKRFGKYWHIGYNFGPGNTRAWKNNGARWDRLPRETQDYVLKIRVAEAKYARLIAAEKPLTLAMGSE